MPKPNRAGLPLAVMATLLLSAVSAWAGPYDIDALSPHPLTTEGEAALATRPHGEHCRAKARGQFVCRKDVPELHVPPELKHGAARPPSAIAPNQSSSSKSVFVSPIHVALLPAPMGKPPSAPASVSLPPTPVVPVAVVALPTALPAKQAGDCNPGADISQLFSAACMARAMTDDARLKGNIPGAAAAITAPVLPQQVACLVSTYAPGMPASVSHMEVGSAKECLLDAVRMTYGQPSRTNIVITGDGRTLGVSCVRPPPDGTTVQCSGQDDPGTDPSFVSGGTRATAQNSAASMPKAQPGSHTPLVADESGSFQPGIGKGAAKPNPR